MSQLSERDLALLSSLIYCDAFVAGTGSLQKNVTDMLKPDFDWDSVRFCGDFGHLEGAKDRQAAIAAFKEVLVEVQNSSGLQNMKIVRPMLRDGVGITAACFVDNRTNDATVVFRGTDGSYKQWYDNFEGAGTDRYTPMQKAALDYMALIANDGYNNITVTGHSKGGNLAAFVTLFCPEIARCINFDGQGFSEYFHNKFRDEINANRDKIKTIASYNDFVNILMFSIAGETIFVNNNNESFPERHYMLRIIFDNLYDENGNFITTREQESLMKILKAGLDTLLILLPAPVEEWFIDMIAPILSLLLGKNDVTPDDIFHALTNTILGLSIALMFPALFKAVVLLVVAVVLVVVVVMLIDWAIEKIMQAVMTVVATIVEVAKKIGEWAVEFVESVKQAISDIIAKIKELWNRAGVLYAAANPYFKVDTDKLNNYATRINNVNNRLIKLDIALHGLYWQVGLLDLWDILVANLLTSGSPTLTLINSYLCNSADRFESAENKARANVGG